MARFIDVTDRAGKHYNLNIDQIVFFTAESDSTTRVSLVAGAESFVIAMKYTDFVVAVQRETRN